MIQCLFLPNDCNDGSEGLQPAVGSVSTVLEGFFFLMLCGPTGKKDLAVTSERVLIMYLVNVVKERSCVINMCQVTF